MVRLGITGVAVGATTDSEGEMEACIVGAIGTRLGVTGAAVGATTDSEGEMEACIVGAIGTRLGVTGAAVGASATPPGENEGWMVGSIMMRLGPVVGLAPGDVVGRENRPIQSPTAPAHDQTRQQEMFDDSALLQQLDSR